MEFSGPLPLPSLLQGYENACPGAADRIIKMAEQEAEHRRNTETYIVNAGAEDSRREFSEARLGQISALVIVLASIGGAIFLGINGHEVAASAVGLGAVGSVVTTFITGRESKTKGEVEPPALPPPSPPNNGSSVNPRRKGKK
jgi:uncharacterized membrane protein